jgi:hypothetical protein
MRRQLPGRREIEQVRALLGEIATVDPGGPLGRGFGRFGSWRALAAIAGTGWLPLPRRPSATSGQRLRQRLRALGAEPTPAAELASGEPVQVRGICAPLPGTRSGTFWRASVVEDADGAWVVDEGEPFVLSRVRERPVLVLPAGGRLVNAERLQEGDEVCVFGVAAEAPDRAGIAHGRGGLVLSLSGSPTHPLLVSVIRRYDQEEHGPQD